MKLNRRIQHQAIGLNLTPMIDVVFLLLIFFMTVSQITRNLSAGIHLPLVPVAGAENQSAPLEVAIGPDGTIRLGGNEVKPEAIVARLQELSGSTGTALDQLPVQLRVDRDCDSAVVNRLLDLLARNGVQRVWSAVLVRE